jgi:hypothetical protein
MTDEAFRNLPLTEQRRQLCVVDVGKAAPSAGNPTVEDKLRLVGFDALTPAEKRYLHRRQGLI